MKILKLVGNLLFYGVIIAMIALCVVLVSATAKGEQPVLFDHKFFIVLTGSMSPAIEAGDLIIDKVVEADEVEVNDVITFESKDGNLITTHRVIDVVDEDGISFTTQGDANNVKDPDTVSAEQLLGKVVYHVPNLGNIIQFLKDNIILVVGSGLAIIFGGSLILASFKKEK